MALRDSDPSKVVYDLMWTQKQELDELLDIILKIQWYVLHPPPLFADPRTGTDTLRVRPKIEIHVLTAEAQRILSEVELLHAAHYDRNGRRHGT